MSKIYADTIETENPNVDITLGAAGDAVLMPTGATLKNNTIKDAGGNTIFSSDGSGTLSDVNSAFNGSNMQLLTTNTASDSANLSFTTLINGDYFLYMFIWRGIKGSSNGNFFNVEFSTDAGSTWSTTKTTSYVYAYHEADGGSGDLSAPASRWIANATGYQNLDNDNSSGADASSTGRLYLFYPSAVDGDPQTYGAYKQIIWKSQNKAHDGTEYWSKMVQGMGYLDEATAITGADFKMTTGNIVSGTVKMYGIGGSV
tara:strand:- start:80 stop:853 length:774 start_codon:yes stop_codon:yes gene_type:complete